MAIARDILHKEFGEPFFPRSVVDKVDTFLLGIEIGKKNAVKHGHWIIDENEKIPCYQIKTCSLCGCRVNGKSFNFCPSCGAKMDGEA
jgi:hypothetical protein